MFDLFEGCAHFMFLKSLYLHVASCFWVGMSSSRKAISSHQRELGMADAETCTKTEAPFKTETCVEHFGVLLLYLSVYTIYCVEFFWCFVPRGDIKSTLWYAHGLNLSTEHLRDDLFWRETTLKGADARNVAKLWGKFYFSKFEKNESCTFLASRDFKQKLTNQKLTNWRYMLGPQYYHSTAPWLRWNMLRWPTHLPRGQITKR